IRTTLTVARTWSIYFEKRSSYCETRSSTPGKDGASQSSGEGSGGGSEVGNMPSVTRQRTIPQGIRSLGGMDSPDYIDLFTVTATGAADASPERWCRTAIEDVAGRRGQLLWRGVLGLRLRSRPSTERVGGWRIAARGEDWIRLEASSWFLTAHL